MKPNLIIGKYRNTVKNGKPTIFLFDTASTTGSQGTICEEVAPIVMNDPNESNDPQLYSESTYLLHINHYIGDGKHAKMDMFQAINIAYDFDLKNCKTQKELETLTNYFKSLDYSNLPPYYWQVSYSSGKTPGVHLILKLTNTPLEIPQEHYRYLCQRYLDIVLTDLDIHKNVNILDIINRNDVVDTSVFRLNAGICVSPLSKIGRTPGGIKLERRYDEIDAVDDHYRQAKLSGKVTFDNTRYEDWLNYNIDDILVRISNEYSSDGNGNFYIFRIDGGTPFRMGKWDKKDVEALAEACGGIAVKDTDNGGTISIKSLIRAAIKGKPIAEILGPDILGTINFQIEDTGIFCLRDLYEQMKGKKIYILCDENESDAEKNMSLVRICSMSDKLQSLYIRDSGNKAFFEKLMYDWLECNTDDDESRLKSIFIDFVRSIVRTPKELIKKSNRIYSNGYLKGNEFINCSRTDDYSVVLNPIPGQYIQWDEEFIGQVVASVSVSMPTYSSLLIANMLAKTGARYSPVMFLSLDQGNTGKNTLIESLSGYDNYIPISNLGWDYSEVISSMSLNHGFVHLDEPNQSDLKMADLKKLTGAPGNTSVQVKGKSSSLNVLRCNIFITSNSSFGFSRSGFERRYIKLLPDQDKQKQIILENRPYVRDIIHQDKKSLLKFKGSAIALFQEFLKWFVDNYGATTMISFRHILEYTQAPKSEIVYAIDEDQGEDSANVASVELVQYLWKYPDITEISISDTTIKGIINEYRGKITPQRFLSKILMDDFDYFLESGIIYDNSHASNSNKKKIPVQIDADKIPNIRMIMEPVDEVKPECYMQFETVDESDKSKCNYCVFEYSCKKATNKT